MKNIKIFTAFLASLVIVFSCYLLYYGGIATLNNSSSKEEKTELFEILHKNNTIEGDIIDRNGQVIVSHNSNWNNDTNEVPIEYSYIVGYNSPIYGSSGIRAQYADVLYDKSVDGHGGTVMLTIDSSLQKKAYKSLQENNLSGSVIIIDNKTSEILTMVSRKQIDYDINSLVDNYEKYSSIEGFFLNNAITDQDPPGSVFKIITSIAAIENGMEDYVYNDTGQYEVDGFVMSNYNKASYGQESLQSAFLHSTNTYFASLGVELGGKKLIDTANRFFIGKRIELDFCNLTSNISYNGSDKLLAQTSFGQGELQISPLHLAMIGTTIANNGVMKKPYIVKESYKANGKKVFTNKEEKLGNCTNKDICNKIKSIMNNTAIEKIPGLRNYDDSICLKTGTAQLGNGLNHSYILSFSDMYTVLVSINNTKEAGIAFNKILLKMYTSLY